MSASHAPFADPVDIPRTWRRWWHERPRWLKIAVWTGVGAVFLQVAIAVRIWFGLMDTPEMARIRAAEGVIEFPSDFGGSRWESLWKEGFWGRSNDEVVSIQLSGVATDEVVAFVIQEFPNLAGLEITESPISSESLTGLERLPNLTVVDFRATNLDDRAAQILGNVRSLRYIGLSETFVSMATVEELNRRLALSLLQVAGTDIKRDEMERWMLSNATVSPYVVPGLDRWSYYLIPGSIHWKDGSVTGVYSGLVKLDAKCDRLDGAECQPISREQTTFTRGMALDALRDLANGADGDYRFVLTLDGHVSAPITFQITSGRPSISRMEFVMPVDAATVGNQQR